MERYELVRERRDRTEREHQLREEDRRRAHELALKDKDIELKRLEIELEKLRDQRASEERDKNRSHEIDKMMVGETTEIRKVIVATQEELRRNPALKDQLLPILQEMLDFDEVMVRMRERYTDSKTGKVDEERLRPLDERMTSIFEERMRKARV